MTKSRLDIAIDAQPQILVVVRHFVSSLAQDLKLSPEEALQLELCVDEAGANSIQGTNEANGEDSNQLVRIEFKIEPDALHIDVIDFGEDFSHFLDRATPLTEFTDRTRKRGYGLQIIKTFMDEVSYQHDPQAGNRLHLIKYLSQNRDQ